MTVSSAQRHRRGNPCKICGGHDALPRGTGQRCAGFESEDYVHCSREEFAGTLLEEPNGTWAHFLGEACKCGVNHGSSAAPAGITTRVKPQISAVYDYTDAAGILLFQQVRYSPKDFRLRRPNGAGGWHWNLEGLALPLPLYRLPELIEAVGQGKPILICEGEKAVERLRRVGLPATCSPLGAGKWQPAHSAFLAGANVCVLPDADKPGRAHAEHVAASLKGVAAVVRVLELPGLPVGGDVFDWFEAGGTVEKLAELLATASDKPPATVSEFLQGSGLAQVLEGITEFLRHYVCFSDVQATATALWLAHSHAIDASECTPYLHISSAEKESGKTRLLELLELLAAQPMRSIEISDAALFRIIDENPPTLLLDEIDAAFGKDAKAFQGLRAILNAGHRRGSPVPRVVGEGKRMKVQLFETFCPKAIAGIKDLPDTIASRSIPIRLKRRGRGEHVERFRIKHARPQAAPLKACLADWAAGAAEQLSTAEPALPEALTDRQQDGWEALLAIADLAGAAWPAKARLAAGALHRPSDTSEGSYGLVLLADLRRAFDEIGEPFLPTKELLVFLINECETSPWAEWWSRSCGAGNTQGPASRLSKMLKPYAIERTTQRRGADTFKGYKREAFEDSWMRYLPPIPPLPPLSGNKVTRHKSDNLHAREIPITPENVPGYRVTAKNGQEGEPGEVQPLQTGSFRPCPNCGRNFHTHSEHQCQESPDELIGGEGLRLPLPPPITDMGRKWMKPFQRSSRPFEGTHQISNLESASYGPGVVFDFGKYPVDGRTE